VSVQMNILELANEDEREATIGEIKSKREKEIYGGKVVGA